MVFSGFLCVFGKYVFGVFCKKKKNHLSNLNSVKKEFTCCLHHAGGASELWGHQDVIYSPLNAPLHKGSALLPRIAPPAALMNTSTT